MKINDKVLSIPPYISTSWNDIKSLQKKGPFLIITLTNGEPIGIPNLTDDVIEQIFTTHSNYLESASDHPSHPMLMRNFPSEAEMSYKLGIIGTDEGIGNPFIHNPLQKDGPDVPEPVLQKLIAITNIISPDVLTTMPKAEANCNCLHCQLVRSIHSSLGSESPTHTAPHAEVHEEEVKAEDLHFQQWEISSVGDKLYQVINKLDEQEKYNVYLGNPMGCTCGLANCEHIVAVLKS